MIDAHVHAFPDAATGRAWQDGDPDPKRSGSAEELMSLMRQGSISRAVVLLFARVGETYERARVSGRSEEQARGEARRAMRALNAWGCDLARTDPRFVAFVGIDPRFLASDEVTDEIVGFAARGASGVKIIPARMRLYPTDPLLRPIYQACAELGLPLLAQSGAATEPPGTDPYGRPHHFAGVLEEFPRLTLILAHLGRGYEEEVVELTGRYGNVYADTSLRLGGLGKPGQPTAGELVALIRRIGIDRVLFGSNYPYANPAVYALILGQLPLAESERRAIAAENVERIVGRTPLAATRGTT